MSRSFAELELQEGDLIPTLNAVYIPAYERALNAKAAALKERDEARAVLGDLLEERGLSWVSLLIREREWLMAMLYGEGLGCECPHPPERNYPYNHMPHRPDCNLGAALRLIGGPEETQRQCDAAHEEALRAIPTLRARDIEPRRPCERCNGTGTISIREDGAWRYARCHGCAGSGYD